MNGQDYKITHKISGQELSARQQLIKLFKETPIPDDELLDNLGLFIRRQSLTRMLFLNDLYKKMIRVAGVVMEFGARWGQNLALFESLRGLYEPYNYTRRIIGFDTFTGFPSVHDNDKKAGLAEIGAYATSKDYEKYLARVLDCHEQESPVAHIKKYNIIKGEAGQEIEKYLQDNPETIVALAYFDLDLYEPTKKILQAIKSHLTRGSVVVFDELNSNEFPGEAMALKEVFGLDKYKISRSPHNSLPSYIVID